MVNGSALEDTEITVSNSHVRRGIALEGALPFNAGTANVLFRGQVLDDHGEITSCFIKDLDPRQLANELMAAALGLAAGMPIPRPIIVKIDPGVLAASKCPLSDGSGHLAFASSDVQMSTVQQLYLGDAGMVPLIHEKLAAWPGIGGMYGFDTWIANTDRHQGNLLFAGQNEVWLIDHGHSFTGPNWASESLVIDQDHNNRLAQWLTPSISVERREEAAGPAGELPSKVSRDDMFKLGETNYVAGLLTSGDYEALVQFLSARAVHVPRLASEALGLLV
jgi:hypothetical protein